MGQNKSGQYSFHLIDSGSETTDLLHSLHFLIRDFTLIDFSKDTQRMIATGGIQHTKESDDEWDSPEDENTNETSTVLFFCDTNSYTVKKLERHKSPITHLKISQDGKQGISGDLDGNIVIWNLDNFEEKPQTMTHDSDHRLFNASPNMNLLVFVKKSKETLRWHECEYDEYESPEDEEISAIANSANIQNYDINLPNPSDQFQIWNLKDSRLLNVDKLDDSKKTHDPQNDFSLKEIYFSENCNKIICVYLREPCALIQVYNIQNDEILYAETHAINDLYDVWFDQENSRLVFILKQWSELKFSRLDLSQFLR